MRLLVRFIGVIAPAFGAAAIDGVRYIVDGAFAPISDGDGAHPRARVWLIFDSWSMAVARNPLI